jgi:hypothetical protein
MISWEQWSMRWGNWSNWRSNGNGSTVSRDGFSEGNTGTRKELPARRERAIEIPQSGSTDAECPPRGIRRVAYSFKRSH